MKLEDVEEEITKFTHEVGEKFLEVKEHVMMSVERYSLGIAFVLMAITTAVLVIGTLYVWCFHHPDSKKYSKSKSAKTHDNVNAEDNGGTVVNSKESNGARKRIPSNNSVNNNDSPVKSKIPVRMRTKSS